MKMRTILLLLMSVCLVCGLASTSMAVTDPTGDACVSSVDIIGASAQTFDKEDVNAVPTGINLGIKMSATSHVPGMIMWDFDVDQNATTGGGSTLVMPFTTAEGGCTGPFKTDIGFELYVVMFLRAQSDTAQIALASDCKGKGSQCNTRGATCSGCAGGGTYFNLGGQCTVGDPGCYEMGTQGTCTQLYCYPLSVLCGATAADCGMGPVQGEWYASSGIGGKPFVRGNVYLSSLFNRVNEKQLCAKLPWFRILAEASASGIPIDFAAARANPPKWQMSAWEDLTPFDGDDMFDPGLVLNLADYVPNTGLGKATGEYNQYAFCKHNVNEDQGVDAIEVTDFLTEFGRSQYSRPCPTCKY